MTLAANAANGYAQLTSFGSRKQQTFDLAISLLIVCLFSVVN